jgi:polar amino acid transport system substrate-binding protein
MQVNRARLLGTLVAIALLCAAGQAQPADPPISDKELVIATKEAPPFVIKRPDGTWHGISIDLWRRIADRLHLRYRLSEQPTVPALLAGTAEGSFDAAIAAVTVTAARDRSVDFTQPFYSTGLGSADIGGICYLALGTGQNRAL